MINSRAKGKRGELDAVRFLQEMTGLRWERTAQRWGKDTADVWCPTLPSLKLHVEVKLWASGLTRMVRIAQREGLTLTEDGILVADAALLPIIAERHTFPTWERKQPARHLGLRRVIDKAVDDCREGHVALLLFRTDNSEWCAAWRECDDDAVMDIVGPLAKSRPHEK